jgi:archaellin
MIEDLSRIVVTYDIVKYTNVNETHIKYLKLVIKPRAGSEYLDFEKRVIA